MSLHVLDIAENSANAGASKIAITIRENAKEDRFEIKVVDNGRGMDIEKKLSNPYYTEKDKKFGLGIPLFEQAASWCGGGLSISHGMHGKGTVLKAWFKKSHIDLKPLGDMGSTMASLAGGHPEINYEFTYETNGYVYMLDTALIREGLGNVPLNIPSVLKLIKEDVNEGIRRLHNEG